MRLDRVTIRNFRSIENIEIKFDPACRVLVGINESGKSNILKALSTISKSAVFTKEDVREPLPSERSIEEAYVRFVFKLSHMERQNIYDSIKENILTNDINKPILQNNNGTGINLKDFCGLRDEGLYNVDIETREKKPQYWVLKDGYAIAGNWKKPSASCPADYTIERKGEQVKVAACSLINADDYIIDESYLESVEPEYINGLVGGQNRGRSCRACLTTARR